MIKDSIICLKQGSVYGHLWVQSISKLGLLLAKRSILDTLWMSKAIKIVQLSSIGLPHQSLRANSEETHGIEWPHLNHYGSEGIPVVDAKQHHIWRQQI